MNGVRGNNAFYAMRTRKVLQSKIHEAVNTSVNLLKDSSL